MASWRGASAADRMKLVAEMLKRDGRQGGAASVMSCLDAAAGVPGHADLPTATVVQACKKNEGEPV